jgi:hypothetical protein
MTTTPGKFLLDLALEHRADLAEPLGGHADRLGSGRRQALRPHSRRPHQDGDSYQHGCRTLELHTGSP